MTKRPTDGDVDAALLNLHSGDLAQYATELHEDGVDELYRAHRRGDDARVAELTGTVEHDCEDCVIPGPGGRGFQCSMCGARVGEESP